MHMIIIFKKGKFELREWQSMAVSQTAEAKPNNEVNSYTQMLFLPQQLIMFKTLTLDCRVEAILGGVDSVVTKST